MKDLTLYECSSSPTVPFPFSRALRSNFLVCGQPTEDSRGNSANAAKIRLRTDHPTPLNHSLFPHSSFMQRNRRHTVYDLTALNLHEDGSRLDLDGHLTSRRAFAQRSRAVRDARGNVISRSLPVVPRVRRVRAEEGEGEEVELDEEAEKTAENADEPVAGPSRKRRRLNQLEDPDLVPRTNELGLPSGVSIRCSELLVWS